MGKIEAESSIEEKMQKVANVVKTEVDLYDTQKPKDPPKPFTPTNGSILKPFISLAICKENVYILYKQKLVNEFAESEKVIKGAQPEPKKQNTEEYKQFNPIIMDTFKDINRLNNYCFQSLALMQEGKELNIDEGITLLESVKTDLLNYKKGVNETKQPIDVKEEVNGSESCPLCYIMTPKNEFRTLSCGCKICFKCIQS